eukprot:1112423-Amphidinium_carterae.1
MSCRTARQLPSAKLGVSTYLKRQAWATSPRHPHQFEGRHLWDQPSQEVKAPLREPGAGLSPSLP